MRLKNELLNLNNQFTADCDYVIESNVILDCDVFSLPSMNFNFSITLELLLIFILKEVIYYHEGKYDEFKKAIE